MKTKDQTHVLAWHFLPAIGQLSNGDERKVVVGETLSHEGEIDICDSGFHASLELRDALSLKRGTVLCRVECWGDKQEYDDKIIVRHRKCLAMVDITPQLRLFAVLCAESALPIFEKLYPEDKRPRDCIEVTKHYLDGKVTLDELRVARKAVGIASSTAYADHAATDDTYYAFVAYAAYAVSVAAYTAAAAAYSANSAADVSNAAANTVAAYAYAYTIVARKQHREWQNKTLISLLPKEFDEWK